MNILKHMEKSTINPFDIRDIKAFQAWRDRKVSAAEMVRGRLRVAVSDPLRFDSDEARAIGDRLAGANMVIVSSPRKTPDRALMLGMGRLFGLGDPVANPESDADGISPLSVAESDSPRGRYIPYTNKPLKWHTDGYYHAIDRPIRAVTLYCAQPAAEGGENQVLDPEIAYLMLRDRDPALVAALMHPEALSIPAENAPGRKPRPARIGPVFQVCADGRLHMRYTRRGRNAIWRDDPDLARAKAILENEILDGDNPFRETVRLGIGEALIGNNVLHDRTAFRDGPPGTPPRLILRARYEQPITWTLGDQP